MKPITRGTNAARAKIKMFVSMINKVLVECQIYQIKLLKKNLLENQKARNCELFDFFTIQVYTYRIFKVFAIASNSKINSRLSTDGQYVNPSKTIKRLLLSSKTV